MKLISHGAAREVTGSCHELQIGDKRILLDCGMFQGSRNESMTKNATFGFDPKDIDAVILSHAHIDHSGRLPLLVKRGFRGPIYCTYATRDLSVLMLRDSGYIQEKDEDHFMRHCKQTRIPCEGPLYTQVDAAAVAEHFSGVNYGQTFDVVPGVKATFFDAGHILGSAMVVLEIEGSGVRGQPFRPRGPSGPYGGSGVLRLGFTGDLGRKHLPILRDPDEMPMVDVLICESTYGDREHEDIKTATKKLQEVIQKTSKRGGKVLIPAFSMERTQEILYDLHLLWDDQKIPAIPIFVDSPLASEVTQVFMMHPECFDLHMFQDFLEKRHHPFEFELLTYSRTTDQSKALNERPGPLVVLAGSGMCEAGRIRHHLRHGIENPNNHFVAVGYMAENTLGRRIVDESVSTVKIFDEVFQKKCEVTVIPAYSGHADCKDLDAFIAKQKDLQKLFLVHGEEGVMNVLAARTLQQSKHAAGQALKQSKLATGQAALKVEMPERGVEYGLEEFFVERSKRSKGSKGVKGTRKSKR